MRFWGADAALATVLFALIAPLVLVPMVGFVYHRYGRLAPLPFLGVLGAVFYALGIVAFTLFPLPADQAAACDHTTAGWHLEPFRSFTHAAAVASDVGVPAFLTSQTFLILAMNVVLLIPLGVLIGWNGRRPVWVAVGAGLAVSVAIELTQGTGFWGLYDCAYRHAEFDDLVTNTTGAVIGWAIGRLLARPIPWPAPLAASTGTPADATASATVASPRTGRRALSVALDALGFVLTSTLIQVLTIRTAISVSWLSAGAVLSDVGVLLTGALIPAFVLFIVVPCVRRDRATVGEVAVLLAVRRMDGSPAGRGQVLIRSGARWWALVVFAAAPSPLTLVAVMGLWAIVDLATVTLRTDRRSLPGLLSRTTTVARPPRPIRPRNRRTSSPAIPGTAS